MSNLASDTVIWEKGLKVLYTHLGEIDAVRFLHPVACRGTGNPYGSPGIWRSRNSRLLF